MGSYNKLLIEKKTGLGWEPIAYPVDDEKKALALLERLKATEYKRTYPGSLRLIRVTTEILG